MKYVKAKVSWFMSNVPDHHASTMLEMTRALSSTGSPRPSWVSRDEGKGAVTPIEPYALRKKASTEVDDFSQKSSPHTRFFQRWKKCFMMNFLKPRRLVVCTVLKLNQN